ncbi:pyrroline-5-carboxylate reductase [Mangrovicoccus sp. HB161399]|uniref:pyrroline-5-carboxylate reductase family protein n=1 Tax=Mangrovicoccus sp. HB161399 TaxID=2720392 RepID=UPI001551E478|nr:pyrroline-5-carboxylate reductase dimerization domain-containing protein [Mangrovicoccus sp. HB161399]
MQDPLIVLAGATGWLGRAIGPALLRQGIVPPGRLVGLNRSGPSPAYAGWPELRWETELPEAAEVVILSVRPQDFRGGAWSCPGALVISLMAGVPAGEIAARTGSERIVRAMPNAAVEIGRSYAPWVASDAVTEGDKALAARILGATGREDKIDSEDQLDVLTALAGSGPAWSALLANALSTAALRAGLPERIAHRAAEAVVCDASQMLAGNIGKAGDLVQDFIDYAGTTAAAMEAARDAGFDGAVREALDAATEKARDMSRAS